MLDPDHVRRLMEAAEDIQSILEATRAVVVIINESQFLIDGIPCDRLRHLGEALIHAAKDDLEAAKKSIADSVRTK